MKDTLKNNKSQTNKKLDPQIVEFLQLYGVLINKYSIPQLAKLLGVSKQAIYNHINKIK
jgi:predicted transcriptional regulator YheO